MIQNILIVDDSHTQLVILEKILQQLPSIKIFKARSGEESLALALNNDFSLALIDIRMPDMDGVELANTFSANEQTSHIAIIFLSAVYPDNLQLSQYNKSIAVDFFLKPINKELLLCKVRSILQLDFHSRNLETMLKRKTKDLNTVLLEWHMTIDAISDYIAIINTDYTILRANKSMTERFGDDIIGKKCYEIFHCANTPHSLCPALNLSETKQAANAEIYEHCDEREIYWSISVFPIKNNGDTVNKYVHIARDITEQKNIDQKLKQGEKMLAIGQLAGGVAHDFNNQLTAILGYATLLKNKIGDDPDLNKFLDTIIKSAKSSADLTKQLLTFSKRDIQQRVKSDIHKMLKEAILLADRPINKKVKIELQLNALQANIMCDTSQMVNAFLNLIINAYDAMPDGGKLVIVTENTTVQTSPVNATTNKSISYGDYIEIKFEDTGTGMPEDVKNHVFEPFFTTKKKKGTGLGLAAVYGTMENHNGNINVTSQEGKGTVFTIQLPIVTSTEIEEETQFDIQDAKDANSATPLVLIADDNANVRNYTQEILKSLNYKVLSAENGKDALELYKKFHQDIAVVILDIVMPEMNGREVYIEIKKINPAVKVIFLSGYSDEDIDDLLSESNSCLIKKPFGIKTLSDALRKYCKYT